ncbi:hypothetical protein AB0F17_59265 [Nonomuraea sp. NPDC026600]|uniref:hypothetical protein n=1 Tax=Nonomuraea sp. NPDC026600 TaxID=3155363 RepID=UPI0034031164
MHAVSDGDPGVELVFLQAAHGEVLTRNHTGAVTLDVGNMDVFHVAPSPRQIAQFARQGAWMFTGSFISSAAAAPVCR